MKGNNSLFESMALLNPNPVKELESIIDGVGFAQRNNEEKPILFRCSSAYKLLTEPKLKADKEAGNLSETTKTFVKEMWLQNEYGYKENIMTDEIKKGLLCEQDSMALVQKVLGGEFRTRYNKRLENHYIIGTPDIVLKNDDYVEDIKTSWNLRTFMNSELLEAYYVQGQCYMWLTGKRKYRLIYCLVPTPDEIILNEQKKLYYKFDCNEDNKDYQELSEQIEYNNSIISSIDNEKKVKVFEFEFDMSTINKLQVRIQRAREFYKNIKL